jgi:transcriptional regulator with XRE-family HTH domain
LGHHLGQNWRLASLAKIKVRPHPGALSGLLKRKTMTQVDAADATGVDRKTLAKIDRGEEVKLETLQNVAKKLSVPLTFFDPPDLPATELAKQGFPWEQSLMLRKLDADSLMKLVESAGRIRWELNLKAVGEKTRGFLEQFEQVVQQFHRGIEDHELEEDNLFSLRFQLRHLKKREDVATHMEQLAEHRLTIIGADYLFWQKSCEIDPDDYASQAFQSQVASGCPVEIYRSIRIALLSVEPNGAQSRRVFVGIGTKPPKFAPDASITLVLVNGMQLRTDDSQPKTVAYTGPPKSQVLIETKSQSSPHDQVEQVEQYIRGSDRGSKS